MQYLYIFIECFEISFIMALPKMMLNQIIGISDFSENKKKFKKNTHNLRLSFWFLFISTNKWIKRKTTKNEKLYAELYLIQINLISHFKLSLFLKENQQILFSLIKDFQTKETIPMVEFLSHFQPKKTFTQDIF